MPQPDYYVQVRHARGKRLLAAARQVNRKRDAGERKVGMAPPAACPLDLHLRTVISALSTGLDQEDWTCVAEGLAMLEEAEYRVRAQGGAS